MPGSTLYVRTDRAAPNRKIVLLDRSPASAQPGVWKTVIPERPNTRYSTRASSGLTAWCSPTCTTLFKAASSWFFDTSRSASCSRIALAAPGVAHPPTWAAGSTRRTCTRVHLAALSHHRLPLRPAAARTPFERPQPVERRASDRAAFRHVEGRHARAVLHHAEGSRSTAAIPRCCTATADSTSHAPALSHDVPAWLELGGVWVTANMRGGGEYGEAWHQAGYAEKKQNVFDDFIAVAEHLVKEKYTSPRARHHGRIQRRAARRRRDEQRPELFAVALPAVGVIDMLRFTSSPGAAWVTEYGSAANARVRVPARVLSAPQLKTGTCYPATLVTTADHDDRVVPSHSFKFAAALQPAQGAPTPC